jgi:hypothetical protein
MSIATREGQTVWAQQNRTTLACTPACLCVPLPYACLRSGDFVAAASRSLCALCSAAQHDAMRCDLKESGPAGCCSLQSNVFASRLAHIIIIIDRVYHPLREHRLDQQSLLPFYRTLSMTTPYSHMPSYCLQDAACHFCTRMHSHSPVGVMYRYLLRSSKPHLSLLEISLLSSALHPALLLLALPLFALHRSRPYRTRALSAASHSFPKTLSVGACVSGSSLVQRPILCSSPCLLRSACLWLWLWCTRGLADIPHTFHAPCNLTTACCTLEFSVASSTLKPRAVYALDLTPSFRFFTLASTIPLCQAVSTKALPLPFAISWLVRSYVGLSSRT